VVYENCGTTFAGVIRPLLYLYTYTSDINSLFSVTLQFLKSLPPTAD